MSDNMVVSRTDGLDILMVFWAAIHFVADDQGAFTAALGMLFDASPLLGGPRSKVRLEFGTQLQIGVGRVLLTRYIDFLAIRRGRRGRYDHSPRCRAQPGRGDCHRGGQDPAVALKRL